MTRSPKFTHADEKFLKLHLVPERHSQPVKQGIETYLAQNAARYPSLSKRRLVIMAVNRYMQNFHCNLPSGIFRGIKQRPRNKLQKKIDEVAAEMGFETKNWLAEFNAVYKREWRASSRKPHAYAKTNEKQFELWPLFREMLKHVRHHLELTS